MPSCVHARHSNANSGLATLSAVAQVCRQWRALVADNSLWRAMARQRGWRGDGPAAAGTLRARFVAAYQHERRRWNGQYACLWVRHYPQVGRGGAPTTESVVDGHLISVSTTGAATVRRLEDNETVAQFDVLPADDTVGEAGAAPLPGSWQHQVHGPHLLVLEVAGVGQSVRYSVWDWARGAIVKTGSL